MGSAEHKDAVDFVDAIPNDVALISEETFNLIHNSDMDQTHSQVAAGVTQLSDMSAGDKNIKFQNQ